MITANEANKIGILPDDEKTPLDILGLNAMTTQEIADKLTGYLPKGNDPISYSCAKQKMIRLERKSLVNRIRVKGLIHWLITQQKA